MIKVKLIDDNTLINRIIANKLIQDLFSYSFYFYLIFLALSSLLFSFY